MIDASKVHNALNTAYFVHNVTKYLDTKEPITLQDAAEMAIYGSGLVAFTFDTFTVSLTTTLSHYSVWLHNTNQVYKGTAATELLGKQLTALAKAEVIAKLILPTTRVEFTQEERDEVCRLARRASQTEDEEV